MSLASFVKILKRGPDGQPVFRRDPVDGRMKPVEGIAVNPVKPHVRGYWLVGDVATITLAASAGLNIAGVPSELRFLIDSQGHFDWAYIIGVSSGVFTLEYFDPGSQRRLQNRPIHSTTIVGSAVRPFRLPEPYFFNIGDSQRQLICTLRDLSGASNTVRLICYGRRFYHKEAPPDVALDIARKFGQGDRSYSYFLVPNETANDGTVTSVAGLGTANFTLESDASADTEIQKLMFSSTGNFTFTIRERSTNRLLMNDVVHVQNGWGNAEFPFYPADTYLLERQKQLIVAVTDLSGSTNFIYLTAAGRRLQLIP